MLSGIFGLCQGLNGVTIPGLAPVLHLFSLNMTGLDKYFWTTFAFCTNQCWWENTTPHIRRRKVSLTMCSSRYQYYHCLACCSFASVEGCVNVCCFSDVTTHHRVCSLSSCYSHFLCAFALSHSVLLIVASTQWPDLIAVSPTVLMKLPTGFGSFRYYHEWW